MAMMAFDVKNKKKKEAIHREALIRFYEMAHKQPKYFAEMMVQWVPITHQQFVIESDLWKCQ